MGAVWGSDRWCGCGKEESVVGVEVGTVGKAGDMVRDDPVCGYGVRCCGVGTDGLRVSVVLFLKVRAESVSDCSVWASAV